MLKIHPIALITTAIVVISFFVVGHSWPCKSNVCQLRRAMDAFVLHAKDSKKKKKKTSTGSIGDIAAKPTTPKSPQRVTNTINIPVRQQIAWAKAYKRFIATSSTGSQYNTKRFRQEKGPKQEEEEYVEINYELTKPPAIFVDGYNIIFHINAEEGRNIDLEDARDCLISDLCVLRGATGWWIEVVFDAYKVMGPEKSETIDNVVVTYTSKSETADNHIERRFNELSADGFTNMVVATDDNVLRMVAGSVGMGYLSAGMLLEELRIAYRGWETAQEDLQKEDKKNRPTLADSLSDDLKQAILQLRQDAAQKNVQSSNSKKNGPNAASSRVDPSLDLNKVVASENEGKTASHDTLPQKKTPKARQSEVEVSNLGKTKQTVGSNVSADILLALEQMRRDEASSS